jgi:thiol-disulfide isomerase/thioredoxin
MELFLELAMKKVLLLLFAVAVLIGAVLWADRVTRIKAGGTAKFGGAADTKAPMAPDFTVKDLDGKDVSLSQFKGKVVLVNFWATWCEPCRDEIPLLIQFQRKYGPRGFTILGLSVDEEGKKVVQPYVDKERFDVNGTPTAMNYPIFISTDAVVDKFGGLIGYPTSILISRDGRIVKRITGIIGEQELTKAIEGLL